MTNYLEYVLIQNFEQGEKEKSKSARQKKDRTLSI